MKKITTYKGNELCFSEQTTKKADLPSRGGHGPATHPAIIDIFARLEHKAIEEVMTFKFSDALSASRFKYMLTNYRDTRKIAAAIGASNMTVYLYKKEPTNE